MAASRISKHSPAAATAPVIYLSSSESSASSCESDSDDCAASKRRTKRQRSDGVTAKPKEDKLLPDGFLDPLQHLKYSPSPKFSGNKNKLEHDKRGDAERLFLLKLLQDHNEPKWRKNDTWTKGAWEKIHQAFNERFIDANATKANLQDKIYRLKKIYKVLKQLSELSGLNWDHSNNMLQGSEDVWQKLLHTNKDAKKWYNTPWPYYSTCQELFAGKSINEKPSSEADDGGEGVTTQPVETSQKVNSLQELEEVDMAKFSTEFKNQKRKNDQCSETTRLVHDETDFSIKTCMEAFYKLDGFTTADVFKVGRIFKSKDNREMFLSLIDEDREFWLRAEIDAD